MQSLSCNHKLLLAVTIMSPTSALLGDGSEGNGVKGVYGSAENPTSKENAASSNMIVNQKTRLLKENTATVCL
jgi:hypothetical protein